MKYLYTTVLLLGTLLYATDNLYAKEVPEEKIKYAGKDFWMTLFKPWLVGNNEFYVTGKQAANITVTYTAGGIVENYVYQPGTILKIPMSMASFDLITTFNVEQVENKSVHIVSDADVVVQFACWGSYADDGTLLFPSDRQDYGNLYYLNGPNDFAAVGSFLNINGPFSIVATCDSVLLEITPSMRTATHLTAGLPFEVRLNKGETYTLVNRATNDTMDLSGTRIEIKKAGCCNPINIFTNAVMMLNWPYDASNGVLPFADMTLHQVLPVAVWDTIHHVVPYINAPFTVVKVVSATDNNIVSFDGLPVLTLAQGGTLDTIITDAVIVHSSGPVSVTQYMIAQGYIDLPWHPDSLGDPNSTWVIPIRDGLREAYFTTTGLSQDLWGTGAELYNTFHVLTLVSRADNIASITLNNQNLTGQFIPFPGDSEYMYANIRPDTGVLYHLQSQGKIIAYYYAATTAGSLDYHLGDINPTALFQEGRTDTVVVCVQDATVLSAGPGLNYQWSTEQTTESIQVTDTGHYSVLKFADDDCIGELKQFVVTLPPPYLSLDLGTDTILCRDDILVLKGAGPNTEWSDGSMGDQLVVNHPGTYWARATDSCIGYVLTDTIRVGDSLCLARYCNILFPNAFSPNNDGVNDAFGPVYKGQVNRYALSIYNRWGERVFASFNIGTTWDGTVDNKPADLGVYYYHCTLYCPLKGYLTFKGEVTLIR